MKHLLTPALLHGYTSGLCLYVSGWDMFMQLYEITNLRHALLINKAPTECIIDILN